MNEVCGRPYGINTISTSKWELKVTNIICASVLLDMSTPDKKRAAESLDSWRKWRSASINSCFLGWTPGRLVLGGTQFGCDTNRDVPPIQVTAVE